MDLGASRTGTRVLKHTLYVPKDLSSSYRAYHLSRYERDPRSDAHRECAAILTIFSMNRGWIEDYSGYVRENSCFCPAGRVRRVINKCSRYGKSGRVDKRKIRCVRGESFTKARPRSTQSSNNHIDSRHCYTCLFSALTTIYDPFENEDAESCL